MADTFWNAISHSLHEEYVIVIPNLELVGRAGFGRDNPNTTVQFLDVGHFAFRNQVEEIAIAMRDFLGKLPRHQSA